MSRTCAFNQSASTGTSVPTESCPGALRALLTALLAPLLAGAGLDRRAGHGRRSGNAEVRRAAGVDRVVGPHDRNAGRRRRGGQRGAPAAVGQRAVLRLLLLP